MCVRGVLGIQYLLNKADTSPWRVTLVLSQRSKLHRDLRSACHSRAWEPPDHGGLSLHSLLRAQHATHCCQAAWCVLTNCPNEPTNGRGMPSPETKKTRIDPHGTRKTLALGRAEDGRFSFFLYFSVCLQFQRLTHPLRTLPSNCGPQTSCSSQGGPLGAP